MVMGYIEIILTIVKSLKSDEPISLLRSHNDLGLSTTPHFCTNDNFKYFFQKTMFFTI
jgi:hypothetical protein